MGYFFNLNEGIVIKHEKNLNLVTYLKIMQKKKKHITLPYGGNNVFFEINDLKKYFIKEKISFLIIGSSHVSLKNHKKKNSLDVWLRKNIVGDTAKNTCQSVNSVVDQIIATKFFTVNICICPITNRNCKALFFSKQK